MSKPCPSGKKRVRVRGHNRCIRRVAKRPKRPKVTMRQCKTMGHTWVRGSKYRRGYCRGPSGRGGSGNSVMEQISNQLLGKPLPRSGPSPFDY